ncbi:MAG TPA: hypothetical protein DHV26_06885 [Cytophagales bacterium]|nr:hypothetical protein [Cytophagales bacterium]HRG10350.1 hypothetical protein [Cyclobacteriaceae bacterium]
MSDFKLKIETKKLQSGRFQVNFSTGSDGGYYGYLLAEPQTAVSEILSKINRHIAAFDNSERYFQRNLFSLGNRKANSGRILIFKR